jgi:hypothetical protein
VFRLDHDFIAINRDRFPFVLKIVQQPPDVESAGRLSDQDDLVVVGSAVSP